MAEQQRTEVTTRHSIPPGRPLEENEIAYLEKLERGRRLDLDVRGLLAIIALVGAFLMAGILLSQHKSGDIPAWAAAVVASIVGFYFGSKGGPDGNGRKP